MIYLKNAYREDEFITTSDMNFRPVNTYTGPDGCLYIVDMYRGIIQEATWVQPGMPIYDQVKSKKLDRNIRRGRIYRLVHEKTERGPKPAMLDETSAKLVTYLQHPNGWWRDNAQKELIVRNDLSVVPALKQLLQNNSSATEISRLHALWTIDGLDAIDKQTAIAALRDKSPQIRKAGIRLSEKYLQMKDAEVIKALLLMQDDSSNEVVTQLALSLHSFRDTMMEKVVSNILLKHKNSKLISGVKDMFARNEEMAKFGSRLVALDEPARKLVTRGSVIFNSLCSSCHGPRGEGLPAAMAPPLIGKFKLIENKEGVIRILLNGLKGPVDGKTYPDVMMPMKSYNDEWIASVLSYVRFDLCMQSFPNMPSDYLNWVIVRPDEVKKIRSQHSDRQEHWTWDELMQKKK